MKKTENILQGGTPKKIVEKKDIWCILVQIDNHKNDPRKPKKNGNQLKNWKLSCLKITTGPWEYQVT